MGSEGLILWDLPTGATDLDLVSHHSRAEGNGFARIVVSNSTELRKMSVSGVSG